jgi:hypothetical protein
MLFSSLLATESYCIDSFVFNKQKKRPLAQCVVKVLIYIMALTYL